MKDELTLSELVHTFKTGTVIKVEFVGHNQPSTDELHVQRVEKDLFICSGLSSTVPHPGTLCNIQFSDLNGRYVFSCNLIVSEQATDNRIGRLFVMSTPKKVNHVELRDKFRLEVLLPAEINYSKFKSLVSCQIVNLSAGGCLLGVNQLFYVSDEVELWFRLPLSSALEMADTRRIRGEVVRWVDPETVELHWENYYGISFLELKHSDEEAIYRYLQEIKRSRQLDW